MSITEQELEAAKTLLREEFKTNLEAALQELSVQIRESHNQVVEAAQATFGQALQSVKEAIGAHDETLKAEAAALSREAATAVVEATAGEHDKACREALEKTLKTIRKEMAPSLVVPEPADDGSVLMLEFEKQRLYLDGLADRLGQPRMEAN